jgi:ABC-2 type transport system permease protein
MATPVSVPRGGTRARTGTQRHAVRDFLAETRLLYVRSMRKMLRRPVALYFTLLQPLIWLLLFGQIFNRISHAPGLAGAFGVSSYFAYFMPAVILQTILFGAGQSGAGMLTDMNGGFLDKLLTTPIGRTTILLGRVLADLTRLLVQGLIVVALAWGFGQINAESSVTYANGLAGVVGALFVAMLFGLGLAALNVFIALLTKSAESTMLVSTFLTLPLLFTSSAQLPLQLLPDWLQTVARFNPVTYAVSTMRLALYGASPAQMDPTDSLLVKTGVILGGIVVVTVTLAVRSFRQSVR